MTYPRTIVGLFNNSSSAQVAVEHLLAAGFAPDAVNIATQATLRGQHLPDGGLDTSHESLRDGLIRFFAEVFTSHDEDPHAYAEAAAHPDSAVVTVEAATDSGAQRARTVLDTYGAIDVYKQTGMARPNSTASMPPTGIDLEGDLSRVRDSDELDDNGLTTH